MNIIRDIQAARGIIGSNVGLIYYLMDSAFFNILLFRGASFIRGSFLKYTAIHVLVERLQSFFMGVHFPPSAVIGPGLVVFHGYGIIIHPKVIIGANCIIYHRVTIGQRYPGDGTPLIGDNVTIGCNATIVGPIVIRGNSRVAANSLVKP
jgi:serine acetyltransferase